jgi:dihydrofolate synthase/folylpolyglutamate synthase
VRWGLETTTVLLAGVGDPHRRFHAIHIGGTNGKGSVAALCDAALRSAGAHRVGLYTSPHLVRFNERIRIDGVPVRDDVLRAAAERLRPAVERTGASFFEATTALAFLLFAEAGVDFAVVEVGLGGRLDATNVLVPLATAVTNVGVDHTEYLGGTLAEIAREKAGIWKPGVPALTAEADPAALRVLRDRAAETGARFAVLDELCEVAEAETGAEGTRFLLRSRRWGARRLRLDLPGLHQARNAALAAELLGALPEPFRPSPEALKRGFAACRWPGRLQRERIGSTTWLFDVAHNPAGAEALAAALDRMPLSRPLVLLAGILSDKAWPAMLPPLLERAAGAVLTVPPSAPEARRWDPAAVAGALDPPPGVAVRVIPDFASALRRVTTLAPHGTVLVTGSVHTVGDAMQALGIAIR